MRKFFKLSMKPHRYIQLFGLYGVLFLIPVMQQQINDYSGQEEDYKRDQIFYATEQIYYDVKNLICLEHGQKATTQNCKKGIYQNGSLSLAAKFEKEAADNKSNSISKFWIIYYSFALLAFLGAYIEYRNEYRKESESGNKCEST